LKRGPRCSGAPDGARWRSEIQSASTAGSLLIARRPDRFVAGRIFSARPRRPTNVQISGRRPGEYDPCACVSDGCRQTAMFGVEGPEDHPVRADGYGRARFVVGVRVAVLRCAAKHVAKPGRRVGRWGLPSSRSLNHCMPNASTHMGGSPTTSSLPGMQTHSLVPCRKTSVMRPCLSISATVACSVITEGPARMVRAILTARICSSRVFAAPCASGKAIAALLWLPEPAS
jgi:hypothetical protein